MPMYDYTCEICQQCFVRKASYDDGLPNKPKCPYCSSRKTRRIILVSAPVIYKGTGFTKAKSE